MICWTPEGSCYPEMNQATARDSGPKPQFACRKAGLRKRNPAREGGRAARSHPRPTLRFAPRTALFL